MPPFFQKTNKLGVQKNILFVQGGAVTVLSLLFVVMPSVQSFYQILSQLTVVLYLIMYMLMFTGAIVLRYKMKKLNRPFRIGKGGNGLMWFIGGRTTQSRSKRSNSNRHNKHSYGNTNCKSYRKSN